MNCKIIDIHTHIYPVALARRAMEVTGQEHDDFKNLPIRENLLTRMQDAGVHSPSICRSSQNRRIRRR